MSQEWIAGLAETVKAKGREPAEAYAREQHRDGIIEAEGKVFFAALVMSLEQDFAEMRAELQGSAVSCETSLVRESAMLVRMKRSRFPWFDAVLRHDGATVVLEYVQGRGVAGEEPLAGGQDRRVMLFAFAVDGLDRLSIGSSFDEEARSFERPEEMARYLIELLFAV